MVRRPPRNPDLLAGDRIVLVDPSVLGQSHLLVNLGFIKLCSRLYGSVEVVAERTHCTALLEYGAAEEGVVVFLPYDSKSDLSARLLEARDRRAPVVFLNLEYRLYLRVMMSSWSRRRPIFWILHSHFASPTTTPSRHLKFWLRKLLLFQIFRRTRFLVYGNRMRRNLLRALGGRVDGERVGAVMHPLGVNQICLPAGGPGPVRISFVRGWHAPPPAMEAVLEALARRAEEGGTFGFSVISNVMVTRPDGSRVITSDYRDRLNLLADTDLVLYLPTNDYSLQASGALMDSFVSCCPLIGLQTDFLREVESLVGPVGFFFESADELLDSVDLISRPDQRKEIDVRRQNLVNGYEKIMEVAERDLRVVLGQ